MKRCPYLNFLPRRINSKFLCLLTGSWYKSIRKINFEMMGVVFLLQSFSSICSHLGRLIQAHLFALFRCTDTRKDSVWEMGFCLFVCVYFGVREVKAIFKIVSSKCDVHL